MKHLTFKTEPISHILPIIKQELEAGLPLKITIPNPSLGTGLYAGETAEHGIHRPWQTWLDLANHLGAHFLNPQIQPDGTACFELKPYAKAPAPDAQGYGMGSDWERVNKLEDPIFLATFLEALERINPPNNSRILALGVNSGRELEAFALAFPERQFEVVGIDLDASALELAKQRFPAATFLQANAHELPSELGKFDLIVALSLFQSPGIQQDVLLASLRKQFLTPTGGFILGYPNARYKDGFLSYGARMRNFAQPDFSLITADLTNAKRGLQKHGFRVYMTGKYEILVTAVRI